jgi:multisubunit Na+/H+ antiporter MnhE subunit
MKNKERKITFAVVFLVMLSLWLLLAGFSLEELIAGCMASLIAATMGSRLFTWEKTYPRRLLWILAYIPYYIYAEIRAHLEVTPGTLTLETQPGKLYVHWLRMKKDKNQITSGFERFLRRVWK